MSQKTRSTLTINAVAQAAAGGVANALTPLRKLDALAGFVLRLFRSKEQLLPIVGAPLSRRSTGGARKRPARIRPGSSRAVRGNAVGQGGLHHG